MWRHCTKKAGPVSGNPAYKDMRRGWDLNPRIEGFADLAIRPLWYRAIVDDEEDYT